MENVGFFEESPGQRSITRVGFIAVLAVALYIAVFQVMTTGHFDVVEFVTMAGTACGLKLGQKSMENPQSK